MNFLFKYQWEVFILLEILSLIALLLFGVFRYLLNKRKSSILWIGLFLFFLLLEALLAISLYQKTGEFSTFQIVIFIFLLYACTFGVVDFKKLDRWMRMKIGQWRGVSLLSEKDYAIFKKQKDPKYIARKYRWTSTIHLIVFVVAQFIFWNMGTANIEEMIKYITDLSWIESGSYKDSPYPNETIYSIGMLWTIIFVVDFIWSWSYTIFPSKK